MSSSGGFTQILCGCNYHSQIRLLLGQRNRESTHTQHAAGATKVRTPRRKCGRSSHPVTCTEYRELPGLSLRACISGISASPLLVLSLSASVSFMRLYSSAEYYLCLASTRRVWLEETPLARVKPGEVQISGWCLLAPQLFSFVFLSFFSCAFLLCTFCCLPHSRDVLREQTHCSGDFRKEPPPW